ncbi:MAG: hypothetical protein LKE81_01380 [Acetobacter sp.]|nr:hypothetical protein [Acetobacter sp.]MCH4060079.1 hypothetical protein [Acetobacter sp.]MCH4087019.1 hypothetical protein [Acetobacter sp.]
MTGPSGGERATQEDIALARCDRLSCWWRGSRPDTGPRLLRPYCERFGPHPMDPSFQRRLSSLVARWTIPPSPLLFRPVHR